MDKNRLAYREAGVDLRLADAIVSRLRALADRTRRPEVEGGVGGFGGCMRIPEGVREPVLVAGMDGVGTKLDLLIRAGRHSVAGWDLVAMCVNDVLAQGAEPFFFLDYLATGRLDPELVVDVVAGIADACMEAGCALLGGETAEMPDYYPNGRYDLAGCAVGIVDRNQVIDGRTIRPGDALLGLSSSGPHSNGFSLIRRILDQEGRGLDSPLPGGEGGQSLADALLAPTRLYVRAVRATLTTTPIKGIAHITGGGIPGNLSRILSDDCRAVVDPGAWPEPPVFDYLRLTGSISPEEMVDVFNLGIGLILVVATSNADKAITALQSAGEEVYKIGGIDAASGSGDRVALEPVQS